MLELWQNQEKFKFEDITYHISEDEKSARIAFNRPEILNAFRPKTVDELYRAFDDARCDPHIGAVILTGNGPSPKTGAWSFSTGGDQAARGPDGYVYEDPSQSSGRLHILEVQRLIRFMPKVVIAVVNGWAVGGGHSLHVVCDLTIASREHAKFRQTDPDVASFDGGFGSAYLARMVGQKKAREIFFIGDEYSAEEGFDMGMVNAVVEHDKIEQFSYDWCQKINSKSPTAIRMLKYGFNLIDDGLVGQQLYAGEATRLAYQTEEAKEGRDAFLEKREKDFRRFLWHYQGMSKDPIKNIADSVGDFIEYWGFKSVHGRIWTYLFLNPAPMSSRDIKETLGISKALLSMSIAELKKYEVIKDAGYGKYGVELYTANSNVLEAILNVLKWREKKLISKVVKEIDKLLKSDPEVLLESGVSYKRLKALHKLASYAQIAINNIIKLESLSIGKWKVFRNT